MNIAEILALKEAFYSCKIEGINKDMTFTEFLIEYHNKQRKYEQRLKRQ